MHSSGSKYISSNRWNAIARSMHDAGIATMKSGALSISVSKWLSKAKAHDAIERVIARCIIECLTLKQISLISHKPAKISSGMKHFIIVVSSGYTIQHSLLYNKQSYLLSILLI